MIGLEGVRGEIERRGYRIVTISTDSVEELANFGRRRSIGYTMLSDEQAQVVRQLAPRSHAAARPAPQRSSSADNSNPLSGGEVLAKLGDANYRLRPAPEIVLATLDGLR
jgi:hypothetical protein